MILEGFSPDSSSQVTSAIIQSSMLLSLRLAGPLQELREPWSKLCPLCGCPDKKTALLFGVLLGSPIFGNSHISVLLKGYSAVDKEFCLSVHRIHATTRKC